MIDSTAAKIGRRMKKWENFTRNPGLGIAVARQEAGLLVAAPVKSWLPGS
jgi:hypothetical protein